MKKQILSLLVAGATALVSTGCATAHHPAMPDDQGKKCVGAPIVYFEIAGPDGQQLKDFYSTAFGWSIDARCAIAAASTGGLKGGIRQDPPEKVFYIGVPDIVKALKQIEAAGGKTVVPRTVVPGVVTFALFTDPAGNRLGLAEFGSYPP